MAHVGLYEQEAKEAGHEADTWRRGKLTPGIQKLFARWFRVFK